MCYHPLRTCISESIRGLNLASAHMPPSQFMLEFRELFEYERAEVIGVLLLSPSWTSFDIFHLLSNRHSNLPSMIRNFKKLKISEYRPSKCIKKNCYVCNKGKNMNTAADGFLLHCLGPLRIACHACPPLLLNISEKCLVICLFNPFFYGRGMWTWGTKSNINRVVLTVWEVPARSWKDSPPSHPCCS